MGCDLLGLDIGKRETIRLPGTCPLTTRQYVTGSSSSHREQPVLVERLILSNCFAGGARWLLQTYPLHLYASIHIEKTRRRSNHLPQRLRSLMQALCWTVSGSNTINHARVSRQRHNRAITRWAAHDAKGHIAWVNLGSDNGVDAGETVILGRSHCEYYSKHIYLIFHSYKSMHLLGSKSFCQLIHRYKCVVSLNYFLLDTGCLQVSGGPWSWR